MLPSDSSNHIFQMAVQFANQTGRHIFLTGKAGTGKTTFLKYIKGNTHKQTAVVAPTGVIAPEKSDEATYRDYLERKHA